MSSAVPGEASPIGSVRQGMSVVDVAGESVGTVELVTMGDPEAATSQGWVAGGGEPEVPGELASQLLRVGFVKVDGGGFLGRDVYVAATQLRDVVQDVVHLGVSRTELL